MGHKYRAARQVREAEDSVPDFVAPYIGVDMLRVLLLRHALIAADDDNFDHIHSRCTDGADKQHQQDGLKDITHLSEASWQHAKIWR